MVWLLSFRLSKGKDGTFSKVGQHLVNNVWPCRGRQVGLGWGSSCSCLNLLHFRGKDVKCRYGWDYIESASSKPAWLQGKTHCQGKEQNRNPTVSCKWVNYRYSSSSFCLLFLSFFWNRILPVPRSGLRLSVEIPGVCHHQIWLNSLKI